MNIFCCFCPKENFPKNSGGKNLAKHNWSGPPAFKCQRYRVNSLSNQTFFITISIQKSFNQSAQFIKSFARCTWFKSPVICKAMPVFEHAHPIIIEASFSFPKFEKNAKNSSFYQFILEIQQILKSQDLKGQAHFWPTPPKY